MTTGSMKRSVAEPVPRRRAARPRVGRIRARLVRCLLGLLVFAAGTPAASQEEAPAAEGYLGVRVVDNASGQTVFSWFHPGPLDGSGLSSRAFDLQRPDVLVAVDGESMNAAAFDEYVRTRAPGTPITIEYRVATNRGTSSIPAEVETRDEIKTITVLVADRDAYRGTIDRGRTLSKRVDVPTPRLLDPLDPDNVLGAAAAENRLTGEIRKLLGVFRDYGGREQDTHSLPLVRVGFEEPFALAELQRRLDLSRPWPSRPGSPPQTISLAEDPVAFARAVFGEVLELDGMGGAIMAGHAGARPQTDAARMLMTAVSFSDVWADAAFGEIPRTEEFARRCLAFLRVPGDTFYIAGSDAREHIEVIRRSMDVTWDPMGNFLLEFERETPPVDVEQLKAQPLVDPPAAAAGFIEGRVVEAVETDLGWIVVGGPGPNRYDMARVVGVYDPGGDDEYRASGLRVGSRAIIDLAGNDSHTGTPDQGPGGAILGASFIDDRAGNDRYEGELLACGAAIYGVSLLLDRDGHDIYAGREWSLGAGVYGAGMILDLGGGNDTYLGEFLCQGVGGPRGLGVLLDEAGRDLYRANGPKPSAYGTPAVFQAFSQGIGFGYRNHAAGGVGLLSDLGGDDRYEAGEFAQGGAYYYALGILHDASGRDLYYGNRYGQGFGVHQAHGVLADDEGDDTYWSMTAASQGAAWDVGAGLLIDRAGNDTYQADGLAQGGASMQGIAMLVDLSGVDRYSAGGGATQGQSGGDSYHHAETGAFSFSLLLDLGGEIDFSSRERANDAVTKTGEVNEDRPENSSAWGLVIDR